MPEETVLTGQVADVLTRRVFPGKVTIRGEKIARIEEYPQAGGKIIIPGLVDSHTHIESSLLVPSQFARLAVRHGVVAAMADPHEIANVLGKEGVMFMVTDGRQTPFRFYFGAPSSVPATEYETAGATLGREELEELFQGGWASFLGEVMNYPGVIARDPQVMAKIALAKRLGLPIDGHAPGLTGPDLDAYIAAGITTDHECLTVEEACEKIAGGMKIMVRKGSAASLTDSMLSLLKLHPEAVFFCSDDVRPDELIHGYIDAICRRAINLGYDPLSVLAAATVNPARHYGLKVGLLQEGDDADLVVIDDFRRFQVEETHIKGRLVARRGETFIAPPAANRVNRFRPRELAPQDLAIPARGKHVRVILAEDGLLYTGQTILPAPVRDGFVVARPEADLLKLAVINRYRPEPPALALVRGFGLREGAMATSQAHDSHNIIAVGTTDEAMAAAVNMVMASQGALAVTGSRGSFQLPLPIGGLMTDQDAFAVAASYRKINDQVRKSGSSLTAPFMTLSFMGLLVIPALKLSDRGLFDGDKFTFTDLFADG
jgi:adenine deaminase